LVVQPSNYVAVTQIGLEDLAANHPNRAATWPHRANQLKPYSAEENAYEFSQPTKASPFAITIESKDAAFNGQYAAFRSE
jgi:hypothetical protein